jgi:hypothetical protein
MNGRNNPNDYKFIFPASDLNPPIIDIPYTSRARYLSADASIHTEYYRPLRIDSLVDHICMFVSPNGWWPRRLATSDW